MSHGDVSETNQEPRINDLLRGRRSTRAFSSRSIAPETLARLFEAARWAPSSGNGQPRRFIVATKEQPEKFARLLSLLVPGNAAWAQNAAALMLSVAEVKRADGSPNRHAFYDTGQAAAHLLVQAQEEGIFVRQMGGFDVEKARSVFQLPDGFEPVAMAALGYPGDAADLPEEIREKELMPRTRKAVGELFFDGEWGKGWG